MSAANLLIVLFSCVLARAGLTTVLRNLIDAPYHFYSDEVSALLFYLLTVSVCVKAFALNESDQRTIVGNSPDHLQLNLATLCGIMFVLFSVGEHGIEVYLAARIDTDLVSKMWGIYDGAYKGFVPTFTLGTLLYYFVGVVAAPIGEEFFFRGLLFPTLMKKHGFFVSASLSSIVFTLLHYQNQFYVSCFVFSFMLCRIHLLYKSLWVCVLIHATYNLIVFTLWNFLGMGKIYSTDQITLLSYWTAEILMFCSSSAILAFMFWGAKLSKLGSTSSPQQISVASQ